MMEDLIKFMCMDCLVQAGLFWMGVMYLPAAVRPTSPEGYALLVLVTGGITKPVSMYISGMIGMGE